MCKVRYLEKVSSAAHGGQGFDLELEHCSEPNHNFEYLKKLGEECLQAARELRKRI
jgi:hypothetical protein